MEMGQLEIAQVRPEIAQGRFMKSRRQRKGRFTEEEGQESQGSLMMGENEK